MHPGLEIPGSISSADNVCHCLPGTEDSKPSLSILSPSRSSLTALDCVEFSAENDPFPQKSLVFVHSRSIDRKSFIHSHSTSATPMEVTCWDRKAFFHNKPSVEELIRIHQRLHREDSFAEVMCSYPFGKDIMPKTIRELIKRTDYEFFVARLPESQEFLGWIALSFNHESSEAKNKEMYEANLEWTQMCSHILRTWKVDRAGEKSNVWDIMKRASSSLQSEHLPRRYCIINTLVVLPEFQQRGVANGLLHRALEYWSKSVAVGTEWAMWVQAPPFAHTLFSAFGFEEVGQYEVDLGDYGYHCKEEREVEGWYDWKFMVKREASGSAIPKPEGVGTADKGKGKERESEDEDEDEDYVEEESEDEEEHFAPWRQAKGKSKVRQESEDSEDSVAERKYNKGKEKEHRYQQDPQADELIHPAYGDPSIPLAERTRIWEEGNKRLYVDPQLRSAERSWAWEEANERLEEIHDAEAGMSRRKEKVATKQKDKYVPSDSAESLIEAMRRGGVDEEEIEKVKAMAAGMSEEAREEE